MRYAIQKIPLDETKPNPVYIKKSYQIKNSIHLLQGLISQRL